MDRWRRRRGRRTASPDAEASPGWCRERARRAWPVVTVRRGRRTRPGSPCRAAGAPSRSGPRRGSWHRPRPGWGSGDPLAASGPRGTTRSCGERRCRRRRPHPARAFRRVGVRSDGTIHATRTATVAPPTAATPTRARCPGSPSERPSRYVPERAKQPPHRPHTGRDRRDIRQRHLAHRRPSACRRSSVGTTRRNAVSTARNRCPASRRLWRCRTETSCSGRSGPRRHDSSWFVGSVHRRWVSINIVRPSSPGPPGPTSCHRSVERRSGVRMSSVDAVEVRPSLDGGPDGAIRPVDGCARIARRPSTTVPT